MIKKPKFDPNLLRVSERTIFDLRSLYSEYGYKHYKVNKFEKYDLYAQNKNFLKSENILTFTDTNGSLMALKPDITLSIVKNFSGYEGLKKVFYDESVYRPADIGGFKEITQTGLECLGAVDTAVTCEVIKLALLSLDAISGNYSLDLSHSQFISGLLSELPQAQNDKIYERMIEAISCKNTAEIQKICEESGGSGEVCDAFCKISTIYGPLPSILPELKPLILNRQMEEAFGELCEINDLLQKQSLSGQVCLDFSVVNDMDYYNGVVFAGFVDGVPDSILAGGRYDNLLKIMGKSGGAVGFAVYLSLLERFEQGSSSGRYNDSDTINVALPKGRLGEKVYDIFEKAGFDCPAIHEKGRKLIFENPEKNIRFFWVKPFDVAVYVEKGVADIGVVGKDILLEQSSDVYELLDLGLGRCRMAVAAENGFSDDVGRTLVVATKFPNIAKRYYSGKGRDIDIIDLNGSIEIAPLLGLSDVIVDIVETGKTLVENNLSPFETITQISARLISNKSSYKFKNERIRQLQQGIQTIIDKDLD